MAKLSQTYEGATLTSTARSPVLSVKQ